MLVASPLCTTVSGAARPSTEGVMKTRMQPIGMVWNKLPRVVRDMAVSLGKQIRLEMDGADTELDRTIIEAIKDLLVHLVRNSCDHGIEPPDVRTSAGKSPHGKLTLRAYHEGGQVNIEIGVDGTGITSLKKTHAGVEQQRLLLFRAGSFERLAVPLSLVARLEEFSRSAIELAAE